jgi:hypothetical protein
MSVNPAALVMTNKIQLLKCQRRFVLQFGL